MKHARRIRPHEKMARRAKGAAKAYCTHNRINFMSQPLAKRVMEIAGWFFLGMALFIFLFSYEALAVPAWMAMGGFAFCFVHLFREG